MDGAQIQVFIDAAAHYFEMVSDFPAQISSPFLVEELHPHVRHYSGVIGISGAYKGHVVFSADAGMLGALLIGISEFQANVDDQAEELHLDLVGEIANTLAGNAREQLGAEFGVSPPLVACGTLGDIKVASGLRTYCVPIIWNEFRANLLVAILD